MLLWGGLMVVIVESFMVRVEKLRNNTPSSYCMVCLLDKLLNTGTIVCFKCFRKIVF